MVVGMEGESAKKCEGGDTTSHHTEYLVSLALSVIQSKTC